MALALSSCGFDVRKITPHFLDTKNMTCRKYVVVEVKPKVVFKFEKSLPIEDCDGFMAIPPDQAKAIQREWESSEESKVVKQ